MDTNEPTPSPMPNTDDQEGGTSNQGGGYQAG